MDTTLPQAGSAVKRALGVVPQELAIYPKLTGKENLDFFGELYGIGKTRPGPSAHSQMLESGRTVGPRQFARRRPTPAA